MPPTPSLATLPSCDITDLAYEVSHIKQLRWEISQLKARQDELEARIKERLGSRQVGLINGLPAVTWRETSSERLSQSLLKEHFPLEFELCKISCSSRTFLLK
jgi:predicted phage-related endonuclease